MSSSSLGGDALIFTTCIIGLASSPSSSHHHHHHLIISSSSHPHHLIIIAIIISMTAIKYFIKGKNLAHYHFWDHLTHWRAGIMIAIISYLHNNDDLAGNDMYFVQVCAWEEEWLDYPRHLIFTPTASSDMPRNHRHHCFNCTIEHI